MTGRQLAGSTLAAAILVILLCTGACGLRSHPRRSRSAIPAATPPSQATEAGAAAAAPGFLYGRVTTVAGDGYTGRLRFGSDQEAFWDDTFNGYKPDNPWAASVPAGRLPLENRPLTIFGVELVRRERPIALGRPFVTRLGDIARVDIEGRDVRVTLKSGTLHHLDRFDASDFDDGIRVWDPDRGTIDLDSNRIRSIELLPTPPLAGLPARLHGTAHTSAGDFTGALQWDRQACVSSDTLDGTTASGPVSLPFDGIRALAKSARGVRATLADGREVELLDGGSVGPDSRGLAIDDPRLGRVLIDWRAFERLELQAGDSGPAYGDFPPGRPLTGTVSTRSGRRLAGRLVYDLDESETTDSLDAPARGVNYSIPFALVESIVTPATAAPDARAEVTLRGGERLELELAGDLAARNGGILVFTAGDRAAAYVPWADVARVELDRPPGI